MEKPGRNDPCPCGSGLKYKRCHGSVLTSDAVQQDTLTARTIPPQAGSIKISIAGLPGEREQVHLINRFVPGDPRNSTPIGGAPGSYQVTFVLGRPGYSQLPERQYSFANGLQGDSHLAITKPAFTPSGNENAIQILISATTEGGRFTFRGIPNQRGFLGKVISEPFTAQNRQDAETKAYRALLSSLSNWSIHLDIPLDVVQLETVEIATGNVQTGFLVPYLEAPCSVVPAVTLSPEFCGLASLYREALISNSPVYRFLCLYKIIEAIWARRKRLERSARQSATVYQAPVDVLPNTDKDVVIWLNSLYPVRPEWDAMSISSAIPAEVRGLEISAVVKDKLKPLRDNISHALGTASGHLAQSADELLHLQTVNHWLPFSKCITRRMLKSDFPAEFLPYLTDDGTIATEQSS